MKKNVSKIVAVVCFLVLAGFCGWAIGHNGQSEKPQPSTPIVDNFATFDPVEHCVVSVLNQYDSTVTNPPVTDECSTLNKNEKDMAYKILSTFMNELGNEYVNSLR